MPARVFSWFLQLCRWRSVVCRCTVTAELAGSYACVALAKIMVKSTQLALNDAAEWLGDWHPLAEQLGSTDGLLALCSVSSELRLPPVHDAQSLERALRAYQTH